MSIPDFNSPGTLKVEHSFQNTHETDQDLSPGLLVQASKAPFHRVYTQVDRKELENKQQQVTERIKAASVSFKARFHPLTNKILQ